MLARGRGGKPGPTLKEEDDMDYTKKTICPDCSMSYETDKNLRCCLDHMDGVGPSMTIEEVAKVADAFEESAWDLFKEREAYKQENRELKAGNKTLMAKNAELILKLRSEEALTRKIGELTVQVESLKALLENPAA